MNTRDFSWSKAAGAYGWRPTTLVVPNVEMIRGLNLRGTPRVTSACRGTPLLLLILAWTAISLQRIWLTMFLVVCLYNLSPIFLLLTLTLKMEASYSTRMFVSPFKTVQYHNSEDQQSGKGSDWVLLRKGFLNHEIQIEAVVKLYVRMTVHLWLVIKGVTN
jgi:hypothetical protein